MIRSFRCAETERVFKGEFSRKFQAIEKPARRRLIFLDGAPSLADLAAIPGYHLEALRGDRVGQYSIRVNDQYRICFTWEDPTHSGQVEIVDYQ